MTPVKTILDELHEANDRIQTLVKAATEGDRDFTPDEAQERDALLSRMELLNGKRRRDENFSDLLKTVGGLVPAVPAPSNGSNGNGNGRSPMITPGTPAMLQSLGELFVGTDMYASLRNMQRGGSWQTPIIELRNTVTVNPPGTLVPGGVRILPFLPYPMEWSIASLFSQGTLDGGMVQYLQETGWTNNAAVVAVGALKPESHKTFELKQQGLIKIAHWIPVADEFLEDVAGLRSFIDSQMANGVIEKLSHELINGLGTGGNMMGLIPLPGKVPDVVAGTGPGAPAQAVAQQRAQVYAASRLQPDAVVMSPLTWAGVSSQMTTSGGYLAGPNTFGAGVAPSVWGLRVVESSECPDGTAIVGAFAQGGQLYSKGGVSVQATNSHADFFIRNVTAIRAEIRVALVIYRPTAFGLVTGLPTLPITP